MGVIILILVNTEFIHGKELESICLVKGSTVQTVHFGKDLLAGFKTLVGGELQSYTAMMDDARDIATNRMVDEAIKLNADAIVNIRYTTSSIMQSAAEVTVYGTAVKFI